MKNIVSIILLMVLSIRAAMIHPSAFPLVEDSKSISMPSDAFLLACTAHNWKILSAIQIPSAATFPFELFALQDDPEFHIIVNCSTNHKSMNVTFLARNCEPMYDGLAENSIVFQIDRNQPYSSQVHIQLISSCSNTPSSETAHIGHVSRMWYLFHRSVFNPVENNIKFGLIIFTLSGITGKDYQRAVERTLNHVSDVFFNHTLIDFVPYNLFKMGNECNLISCYDFNVNQSTVYPHSKAILNQDGKMQWPDKDILILLLLPLIIGLILFGMIIFYARSP